MSKIDDAKARHTLASVARRTSIDIPLDATGDMAVYCPFPNPESKHSGPALQLHLTDGMFHCFSCADHGVVKETGDVVQWVQNTEGCTWAEAIKILDSGRALTNHSAPGVSRRATRSGTFERPDLERTSKERVLEVLELAWAYYSTNGHAKGVEYLTDRGIDVAVLEAHTGRAEVGSTPRRPGKVLVYLRSVGVTDDELVDAGLVYRSGLGVSAVYRTRMLIPCRRRGRVVGFIGRDITGRQSKYINLARTAVYDKSVNLYQPLPAPTDPDGQVVVVEGTIDAMAIAIAAIEQEVPPMFCPVTQSGKVLSDAQLDYVLGIAKKSPVIAFDGDDAGRLANLTIATAILAKGRECVVTTLPPKKDPATGEPVGWHDPASYLAEYGPEALDAFTRYECLKAEGDAVRPKYGPVVVLADMWHDAGLKGAEGGDVDWAAELGRIVTQAVDDRRHLPESAHARFDTQVAQALAPWAAFEAVQYVEAHPPVVRPADDGGMSWEAEGVEREAIAMAMAHRTESWVSRLPCADQVRLQATLRAELAKAAGETPEVAALIPEAVKQIAQHPARTEVEYARWEAPVADPPDLIRL